MNILFKYNIIGNRITLFGNLLFFLGDEIAFLMRFGCAVQAQIYDTKHQNII